MINDTRKKAGILLPVGSLPGRFGMGDFGQVAFDWIDMLNDAGVSIWQILPLNPIGYGNSPYQSYSSYAGEERYISIEMLYKGLGLSTETLPTAPATESIDYMKVQSVKEAHLRYAYKLFHPDGTYYYFIKDTPWLDDFARYMALKRKNSYQSWTDWEEIEPTEDEMNYERFIQYHFYKQWNAIRDYAHKHDIQIMGDLPFYVGHDSVDVMMNQHLFYLDEAGKPTIKAGVPPDYFSDLGQLWGNPIYNWEQLKREHYQFWMERLRWNQRLYDVIRLDHFRGFDTYWVVDAGSNNAAQGKWELGPGHDFFNYLLNDQPEIQLVAEDLGELRPEVYALRDSLQLKGMNIIQFSLNTRDFESNKTMRPETIVYTGTHDNHTLLGWLDSLSDDKKQRVSQLLNTSQDRDVLFQSILRYAVSLPARWVIIPLQDIMKRNDSARINTPATSGSPNWEWRLPSFEGVTEALMSYRTLLAQSERLKNR